MPISLRLPEDVEARLNNLATLTGRSKTFYAREAIIEHIDDLEDYYIAADVLERVRKGQEQVYSAAELRKELGLED